MYGGLSDRGSPEETLTPPLGEEERPRATCDDAAPSGAHASGTSNTWTCMNKMPPESSDVLCVLCDAFCFKIMYECH
jgi:hypothetical protein